MEFSFIYLISFLLYILLYYADLCDSNIRPIRVAICVDDHSYKDLVILINSVLESAIEPEHIVVHVLACGRDAIAANMLKKSIISSIQSCFPTLKTEILAFVLPHDSGFIMQLQSTKRKSHWTSSSGADMARFYLPNLFPHTERLLYLDNDVIVS
jgi:lipopolysaccharide biosynthesis glycosyltransferase